MKSRLIYAVPVLLMVFSYLAIKLVNTQTPESSSVNQKKDLDIKTNQREHLLSFFEKVTGSRPPSFKIQYINQQELLNSLEDTPSSTPGLTLAAVADSKKNIIYLVKPNPFVEMLASNTNEMIHLNNILLVHELTHLWWDNHFENTKSINSQNHVDQALEEGFAEFMAWRYATENNLESLWNQITNLKHQIKNEQFHANDENAAIVRVITFLYYDSFKFIKKLYQSGGYELVYRVISGKSKIPSQKQIVWPDIYLNKIKSSSKNDTDLNMESLKNSHQSKYERLFSYIDFCDFVHRQMKEKGDRSSIILKAFDYGGSFKHNKNPVFHIHFTTNSKAELFFSLLRKMHERWGITFDDKTNRTSKSQIDTLLVFERPDVQFQVVLILNGRDVYEVSLENYSRNQIDDYIDELENYLLEL